MVQKRVASDHAFGEALAEQIKDIDPRGFQLSKDSGFRCGPTDIRSLPGIETDIRVEGDHI